VRADRLSLLRVFRNLLDNALKYGGEELSEIRIRYEESHDFHVFSVCDNGVGVKTETPEKLFALFQRHETSKGVDGTGLGLAIVKEIVERHQGEVWAEPRSQRGVSFFITISKKL
jgi:K+-sensing histidine kinase KdpD